MHHSPDHQKPRSGYATEEITKAPTWHGLVVFDLLFNNLTTGLFLVAAIGEIAAPRTFAGSAKSAYPVALALLVADLICLVLDLGDPSRFHHMLRVFKPSSPMSLGTWCLTVYSVPLSLIVAVDLATSLHWLPKKSPTLESIRWLALIAGLLPASGSAIYKGVLFSTSSQPGWKDARWLGGYLVNSAFLLGSAVLLAIASWTDQDEAARRLRLILGVLIVLNLVPMGLLFADLRPALDRLTDPARRRRLGLIAIGRGSLAPLILLIVARGPLPSLVVLALIVAGSLAIRSAIVKLPHSAHR